jgi:hypothetical protein
MLSALAVPAIASAHPANISSARAYDLSIGSPLGGSVVGPDTGLISRHGTNPPANNPFTFNVHVLNLPTPLLTANIANATVHTANEVASAYATIAQVIIPQGGLNLKVVTSKATATCIGGREVEAGSALGTLTFGTQKYSLNTTPNTVLSLGPLGSITLNEQIKAGNTITVNAVHIDLLGIQIIVASSTAGVTNCALG